VPSAIPFPGDPTLGPDYRACYRACDLGDLSSPTHSSQALEVEAGLIP
jgi:hypothetical protein